MKLGIIGAGKIVLEFLEVTKDIKEIDVYSICATKRSIDKLKKMQDEFNIEKSYTSVEELLKDDIDAVYIAVPNHLHFEIAYKALENNKNVILEKPFTSTYDEAEKLIELSNKKGLMIFEAISNQFLPNYYKTKELLNTIGDVKIVEMNFSQYSSRYNLFKEGEVHSVFDSTKSGGALMDLNVYNIYFIIGLFGKPLNVEYFPNIEKGVDTSGVLILQYETFNCVAIGSKDCNGKLCISIQGEKGFISSNYASNLYDEFELNLNNGKKEVYNLNNEKHRLYYEIINFYKIFKSKDFKEVNRLNNLTLDVMKVLDNTKKI